MPFTHCLDCGDQALIDPSGRCPEGHDVGAVGARVSAGIGSTTPHPDEPVPWVRMVELDPADVDAAPVAPRVARPLSAAPAPTLSGPGVEHPYDATDDLLRELHALGDLHGASSPAPAAAPPSPPAVPTAPTAPTVPPAPAAVAADRTGGPGDLDRLANLAAAVRTLDERSDAPPSAPVPPPPPASPHPSGPTDLATVAHELDQLFGDADAATSAPTGPVAASSPGVPSTPETPTTDAGPTPPLPAPPAPARLDDLEFTAKAGRSRRRDTAVGERTAKRGLFRR